MNYGNFQKKLLLAAPLDKHSIPNDPVPENKSNTFELFIFVDTLFECSKILKIDSLTISFNGLVDLSNGVNNFFPLRSPDIILIYL